MIEPDYFPIIPLVIGGVISFLCLRLPKNEWIFIIPLIVGGAVTILWAADEAYQLQQDIEREKDLIQTNNCNELKQIMDDILTKKTKNYPEILDYAKDLYLVRCYK